MQLILEWPFKLFIYKLSAFVEILLDVFGAYFSERENLPPDLKEISDSNHPFFTEINSQVLALFTRLTRSEVIANELLHDTIIKVWLYKETISGLTFKNRRAMRAYIFKIARSVFYNWYEQKTRTKKFSAIGIDEYLQEAEQAEFIENTAALTEKDIKQIVYACLKPIYANTFLHYLNGYTAREIAERLSLPLTTVEFYIKASKAAMRAKYAPVAC